MEQIRRVETQKITVPKPFEFEQREQQRGKTLRQQKLEEMILAKQEEEQRALNHRFRANKVPITTKIPLLDNLQQKEEERR